MLTATKQWFTLPVLISCYCFVCTQANSGSVYFTVFLPQCDQSRVHDIRMPMKFQDRNN